MTTQVEMPMNPMLDYPKGETEEVPVQDTATEFKMKTQQAIREQNKPNTTTANNVQDKENNCRTKLNPNAAQFHAKGVMEFNSVPNLNSESTGSASFNTSKRYKDLFIPSLSQVPSRKTNLEMSQLEGVDEVVSRVGPRNAVSNSSELADLLSQYILKKCSLNNYCNSEDFDGTALDSLTKLSFIQSLQAVEHYGASVSQRIVKKSAYLMGIIRGQESHWDNSRAAAHLEGGALQLLHLPKRLLKQVGGCCLHGNCLPSDFTPEVILSLHSLTVEFSMKAINAFDTNKRIVAGCRGGVVNRPRFLQRLIENVSQQNPITLEMIKKEKCTSEKKDQKNVEQSSYSSPKSFLSLLGSGNTKSDTVRESCQDTPSTHGSQEVKLSSQEKMQFLERELTDRIERERRLRQELGNLRVQVGYWEKECHRLNSAITHILHGQGR